jgi:hypothetical protein
MNSQQVFLRLRLMLEYCPLGKTLIYLNRIDSFQSPVWRIFLSKLGLNWYYALEFLFRVQNASKSKLLTAWIIIQLKISTDL